MGRIRNESIRGTENDVDTTPERPERDGLDMSRGGTLNVSTVGC